VSVSRRRPSASGSAVMKLRPSTSCRGASARGLIKPSSVYARRVDDERARHLERPPRIGEARLDAIAVAVEELDRVVADRQQVARAVRDEWRHFELREAQLAENRSEHAGLELELVECDARVAAHTRNRQHAAQRLNRRAPAYVAQRDPAPRGGDSRAHEPVAEPRFDVGGEPAEQEVQGPQGPPDVVQRQIRHRARGGTAGPQRTVDAGEAGAGRSEPRVRSTRWERAQREGKVRSDTERQPGPAIQHVVTAYEGAIDR